MSGATLTVVEPGLLTTVQDLGRTGHLRFGVTTGGALDQAALILANRLVGNDPGAAGLELTLLGPRLRFAASSVIAVTGGGMTPRLNDVAVPMWLPVPVNPGDELTFVPGPAGVRAYLAVAGGLLVPVVLGGRGTDLFGHLGGVEGRALKAGDVLSTGEPAAPLAALSRRRLRQPALATAGAPPLRAVLGPQADRFTAEAVAALLAGRYQVTPQADRMGIRLRGPVLTHTRGADAISEGIHPGSIQVPGDGQPILLTRARQTIGGYPKIATVIGADLDRLGHLRPGDPVTFAAVSVAEARALGAAYRTGLTAEAIIEEDVGSFSITSVPGSAPGTPSADLALDHAMSALGPGGRLPDRGTELETTAGRPDDMTAARREGTPAMAESWTPAAVSALIAALPEAGISLLRLELPTGLRLEVRRGDVGPATPDGLSTAPADRPASTLTPPAAAGPDHGIPVTAPLLGVFYRRPAPDQPPLVEVGAVVAAGDRLGLIEVMKTYHEVTAPVAGQVGEFLAPDGEFVEFGQTLVYVTPVT